MYLVVVYDVEADRTDKPRKFLRTHLQHVQDSVFEGEVTEANAEKIKSSLENLVKDSESVIVYELWSDEYMERTVVGEDPLENSHVL